MIMLFYNERCAPQSEILLASFHTEFVLLPATTLSYTTTTPHPSFLIDGLELSDQYAVTM